MLLIFAEQNVLCQFGQGEDFTVTWRHGVGWPRKLNNTTLNHLPVQMT